jgi:PAS domain S-box-containing protein
VKRENNLAFHVSRFTHHRPVKPSLRILHLEDEPLDAELVQETLLAEGLNVSLRRVQTRPEFLSALQEGSFDLILADFALPAFNGMTALTIARELYPEIPFIFVSGAIGEERAVEALKRGATDYVLKHLLSELVPAVERALREVEARNARQQAIEELRQAKEAAEKAAERIASLQVVTAALSEALTPDQVAQAVLEQGLAVLDARAGSVVLIEATGNPAEPALFRSLKMAGYAPHIQERWQNFAISATMPMGDAVRQAKPIFLQSREDFAEAYPALVGSLSDSDHAWATLPLLIENKPIGVMGLSFAYPRLFSQEERDFMVALGRQCAQALERARLYEAESIARTEAETARHRLEFLAEASAILAATLDYETTLGQIAQLAVPRLADWCAVDMLVESQTRRVAVAHIKPEKVALAFEVERRYPRSPEAPRGLPYVLRTGRAILDADIPDSRLEENSVNREHLELVRDLGYRSAIIAPLVARGRVLGALTFAIATAERRFDEEDLSLAEELARRAALAVDNARLYSEASQLNVELEQRVNQRTLQLQDANLQLEQEITERKQAQEKAAQSRDFYLTLLENFPAMIWRANNQGQADYFNQTWLDFTGRAAAEEDGYGWAAGIHPDEQEAAVSQYQAAVAARTPFVLEYRLRRHDGVYRWLTVHGQPYYDLEGDFAGFISAGYDTTERKLAEEQFRGLLESAPDAMVIINKAGHIVLVNSQAEKTFGYQRAELLGQPVEILMPAAFQSSHRQHRASYQQSPHARPMGVGLDLYGIRQDGSHFPVEISLSPLQTEAGVLITAAVRDITERQQAEEQLRESERQLADAQKIAHLGSWDWDVTSNIVTWSSELYRIYGLKPQDLTPSFEGFLDRVHPDDKAYVQQVIGQALERPEPFTYFHRVLRPDGSIRMLQARGEVLVDGVGNVTQMVGTALDVTELKEAEAQLERNARQLLALGEMGQTVTASLDVPTVLDRVLEQLQPLIPAEGVSILLLEPPVAGNGATMLRFAATSGPGVSEMQGRLVPLQSGLAGHVIRTGQPIWTADATGLPHLFQELEQRGYRVRSLAAVPLRLHGQLIGVLEAVHSQTAAFDADHLQLLEASANWTAIAIGNARLYDGERQARQTTETLRTANVALSQTLDLEIILDSLLRYLAQLVPYDSANVMLLDPDDGFFYVRAMRGYEGWTDPGLARQINFANDNPPLQALYQTRQGVLIDDTYTYPGWERPSGAEHVRNWMGIPLIAGGSLIGVFSADKAQAAFFNENHLRLAEALAAQASIAIQNARLFEALEIGREQLRRLSQQAIAILEEERRRVSRELHDEAGQALTALRISLGLMKEALPAEPPALREQMSDAIQLTGETMEQIRLLAQGLRPPALDTVGLASVVEGYCRDFSARTRLRVECHTKAVPPLPDSHIITLYRFLQEALTNVVRHAQATWAEVRLNYDGAFVTLEVTDDGVGFDASSLMAGVRPGGIGLLGMRERMELLQGTLLVESRPGQGTHLVARLPWQPEAVKRET